MAFKEILLAVLAITTTAFAVHLLKDSKAPATDKHHNNLQAFHAYNRKHGKTHNSKEEFAYRFSVYQDNKKFIKENNKKQRSFTLGENQFADLTFEEFRSKYLSKTTLKNNSYSAFARLSNGNEKFDWREKGVITRVKNQGACGSCWAFSSTGAVESAFAIANKEVVEFSESELVDCSGAYGNEGCNGGMMDDAFRYIIDHKIALESDYPYRPVTGKCHADQSKRRETIKSFKYISPPNINGLLEAIKVTPISVGIEVQRDFQLYKSGVYTSQHSNCGENLNHGVLAVGFDTTASNPFFIVKNSWGEGWGEQGYVRMAIGTGSGTCGIANDSDVYPIL